MKAFASFLESLLLTPSRNQKIAYMVQYFRDVPDPDRGYALALLTGDLSFSNVKANTLKKIVLEKVDENLFAMSYDYVGDLAETIALLWPDHNGHDLPSLSGLVHELETVDQDKLVPIIANHLSSADTTQRWAIAKMATGNLRIGVSARLAKTALAEFGNKTLDEIEYVWHGLQAPYEDIFAWLEGRGPIPEIHQHRIFHPMMLSHPIDEEKDFEKLDSSDFQAEWKWDGIRVQLGLGDEEKTMFSRTGDNIAQSFPDIISTLNGIGVLDGELLIGNDFDPMSFNNLQQRLNRKTVSKKMQAEYPAFIRVYDMLFDGDEDIRHLSLVERRKRLEQWINKNPNLRLDISPILEFKTWDDLAAHRLQGAEEHGHEGLMLKRKDSIYQQGRPKGLWYKWKRDALLVDAVIMYAQRGHGKRSSYYSDYTFGLWDDDKIVPIGKAYSGFTDAELVQLDKWVRNNTVGRFGPVREVKKELVFEVAFDSAQLSSRHKSGIALRFPRINRIRWDKPAKEADKLSSLAKIIEDN
jgi:DNA ligase-1